MVVTLSFEVNIETDRANANEMFFAVNDAIKEGGGKMCLMVLEGYQDRVAELLCSASGRVAKKGLGCHEVKGGDGRECRCRTFKRVGKRNDEKQLVSESLMAVEAEKDERNPVFVYRFVYGIL